jgi:hypothetical protein
MIDAAPAAEATAIDKNAAQRTEVVPTRCLLRAPQHGWRAAGYRQHEPFAGACTGKSDARDERAPEMTKAAAGSPAPGRQWEN